jgi:RHS repeat-associated protein
MTPPHTIWFHYSGSSDPLPSYGFGYAVTGNLSTLTANHMPQASETYGYDAGYQLNEWRRGELVDGTIPSPLERQFWVFDSRGNWEQWTTDGTVEARTHNGVNELLTRDGTTLTYDDNGNMTTDGSKAYVWDEENRLSSVNGAYYQYDALGRRISKTVAGVTTQYIYDGWQVVQESSNLGVTKFFTYGNYIDEPVCMVTTTATSSDTIYYLQGNNYNVAALTDNAGQVMEHYRIEPYGTFVVLRASGADGVWFTGDDVEAGTSGTGNEAVFQGRVADGETGNYYFRNRYHGPEPGRFLSRDPLGSYAHLLLGGAQSVEFLSPVVHTEQLGASYLTARGTRGLPLFVVGTYVLRRAGSEVNAYSFLDGSPSSETDPFGLTPGWRKCKPPEEWMEKQNAAPVTPNGCSVPPVLLLLGGSKTMDPANPRGYYSFESACDAHDKCYGNCSKTQKSCDDAFRQALYRACEGLEGRQARQCISDAGEYYSAVALWGPGRYKRGQMSRCECRSRSCQ